MTFGDGGGGGINLPRPAGEKKKDIVNFLPPSPLQGRVATLEKKDWKFGEQLKSKAASWVLGCFSCLPFCWKNCLLGLIVLWQPCFMEGDERRKRNIAPKMPSSTSPHVSSLLHSHTPPVTPPPHQSCQIFGSRNSPPIGWTKKYSDSK